MVENCHFGHLGHSELSENGPNEFPMPQNLVIDNQNQVSIMLRTKVTSLAILWSFEWPWMAENGHFGHVGQSEVSENGPNEFAMPQNPRIYTKILFLACSEPKLQVWPCYGNLSGHKWPLWPLRSFWGFWKWSQRISHATKPGNRHKNHVSSMLRTNLAILWSFERP